MFLVAAIGTLIIAVGCGLGALGQSYSLNPCYALALALATLAHQGEATAASKSDAALVRLRGLLRSLRLEGSKRSCRRAQLALEVPDTPD